MADSAEIANDELFQKMQKIIADKLEIDPSKVTPDATFRGDLGADSLDTYEESRFRMKPPTSSRASRTHTTTSRRTSNFGMRLM